MKSVFVGGPHTNTVMRQANRAVRAVANILTVTADATWDLNGKCLQVARAKYKDALDDGMRWLVHHWASVCLRVGKITAQYPKDDQHP